MTILCSTNKKNWTRITNKGRILNQKFGSPKAYTVRKVFRITLYLTDNAIAKLTVT